MLFRVFAVYCDSKKCHELRFIVRDNNAAIFDVFCSRCGTLTRKPRSECHFCGAFSIDFELVDIVPKLNRSHQSTCDFWRLDREINSTCKIGD